MPNKLIPDRFVVQAGDSPRAREARSQGQNQLRRAVCGGRGEDGDLISGVSTGSAGMRRTWEKIGVNRAELFLALGDAHVS
jgi:hypothetical protein